MEVVQAIVQPLFAPNQMCADQDRQVRDICISYHWDDDPGSIRWKITRFGL